MTRSVIFDWTDILQSPYHHERHEELAGKDQDNLVLLLRVARSWNPVPQAAGIDTPTQKRSTQNLEFPISRQ